MPSYTNIAKPTGATYTNRSKPGGRIQIVAGMATGLLIPFTISIPQIVSDPYTKITKPT